MKKLNEMLEMETKLLMAFHLQTDEQMERMNQKLEQYLRMYINHRQNNWLKWLVTIEFCHIQVHLSGNYISTAISPPNYTSPPSIAATFLATRLTAVLQPSRYSIFHGRDTPI